MAILEIDWASMAALINLIEVVAPRVADSSLNVLITDATRLGQRLRGSDDGNVIADQLFTLVRKFGDRVSVTTVMTLVLRDEGYSRTGMTALGILYDEHAAHLHALGLPALLASSHPQVAYYCAWREARQEEHCKRSAGDVGLCFAPDSAGANLAARAG